MKNWDHLLNGHDKKPLWKFIVESEPEKIINWLTFKYIEDVLNPDQALKILIESKCLKKNRIDTILNEGYPSYTTAAWSPAGSFVFHLYVSNSTATDGFIPI